MEEEPERSGKQPKATGFGSGKAGIRAQDTAQSQVFSHFKSVVQLEIPFSCIILQANPLV